MAPRVPFEEGPSVQPQFVPIPYLTTRGADPNAFGAQVAEAQYAGAGRIGAAEIHKAEGLAKIGQATESMGDVLAKQALNFQKDLNETAAKDAFLGATVDVGNIEAWHRELSGRQAMDALPEYQRRLMAVREKYKGMLPNAEAQRMFDQEMARRLGFSLVDAGRYSANQFKHYKVNQDKAIVTEAQRAAGKSESDEELDSNVDAIRRANRRRGTLEGESEEEARVAEETAVSLALKIRIERMAIDDAEGAQRLYDKYKDEIKNPQVLKEVEKNVRSAMESQGARIVADKVVSEYHDQLEMPGVLGSMEAEARKRAEAQRPGDVEFADKAEDRVRSRYNKIRGAETDKDRQNWNIVNEALMGGGLTRPDGSPLIPTNEDELAKVDPDAARALNDLPGPRQRQAKAILERNARAEPPFDEKRRQRFMTLLGMARGRDEGDKAKFTQINVMAEDLPFTKRQQLWGEQQKILNKVEDTQTTHAMRIIEPLLRKEGVFDSEERRWEFQGNYMESIQLFQDVHKKRPTEKEYGEIANRLLIQKDPTTVFGFTIRKGPYLYQAKPPSESERAKDPWWADTTTKFRSQQGREPTDEEIRRLHVFREYYKTLPKSETLEGRFGQ